MGETTPAAAESVHGVERALDIIGLFEHGDGMLGVTEIARRLGLAKSVVHRALQACRAKGFVELDEASHKYRLGPAALAIGLAAFDHLGYRVEVRRRR